MVATRHLQRVLGRKFGPLAQLVEQLTLNQLVVGSIPTRPTKSRPVAKVLSLVARIDRLNAGLFGKRSSILNQDPPSR
jgi:hypothetical protein